MLSMYYNFYISAFPVHPLRFTSLGKLLTDSITH
jgi:hypothetical protein